MNVFLPSKAEIRLGTRHELREIFFKQPSTRRKEVCESSVTWRCRANGPQAGERPRGQVTQQGRFRKIWSRLASVRRGAWLSSTPHLCRNYKLGSPINTVVLPVSASKTSIVTLRFLSGSGGCTMPTRT